MIIAQISDTHILARDADDAASARRAEDLRRCVADINRQEVDVVVHTGDGVHHGLAEEYAHLRDILSGLDAPLLPVAGNRDRRDGLREAFGHLAHMPDDSGFLHYAVDDYPLRLVVLDSVEAGERKGTFCARRIAWLDETLAREPARPTVLFIHHPPFDVGTHYVGGYRRPDEAEALATTVARHPQVVRLACGHVHCQHRADWGGTVATTMPSVAVDLRRREEGPGDAPAYLLHAVSDDGDLVTTRRVAAG